MIEFTYRVVELDKPNKNNCVYTKSCIDAMFSDESFLEKMKTNSLLLYRKEDIDDFDSLEAPPIDRAIGYVNLENDYPHLEVKTVLFDNYISSIDYIKDASLFPVWVITAFDIEEFELASDIHIINEAKIEYFVLSDSPAWTIARAVTVCETNNGVFQKIRKAAAEIFKASTHFTPPKTEPELLKVLDKNFKEAAKKYWK